MPADSRIRVLVFPAGEINSLELHEALAHCVNVELFGASSIDRHGPYLFANYISGLPLISEPDFLEKFRELLLAKNIHLVFPTHDTVAEFLAAHGRELPAKILGGDEFACSICRDKGKTYELFRDEPFCPRPYAAGQPFPAFAKPRRGQGSAGARIIRGERDLDMLDPGDMVITEYLPGEEFTVDCLTDNAGALRVISPRSRLRVLGGISMAGRTEPVDSEIEYIAETINSRLRFLGLWWFQIKRDGSGRWKLLEISARCAGSMVLTRARGVNLPLLSVYTAMGRDISIAANDCQAVMDSALMRRFKLPIKYDTVYLDYDDTLVRQGKVNLKTIWFVHQCRNQDKNIALLTRHGRDICESLEECGIAPSLFSKIIQLGWDESKCDHMAAGDCIYIDNSWKEREEARRKLGIPVFDVDGLDFLMDWRC